MTILTDAELAQIITQQLPRLLREQPELLTPVYTIVLQSFADKNDFARLHQEFIEFRQQALTNFDQLDRRMGAIETKVDNLETRMTQGFADIRDEMQQLEGRVDQRFEQFEGRVDQRFEQFEGRVDQRFAEFEDRMEQRLDQRFAEFEDRMEQRLSDQIGRHIARLGQRWGIQTESIFRGTVKALLEESYHSKVEQRWIEGEQFDIIISNGSHILVEITAQARRKTQQVLERKRDIYIEHTGTIPDRFILAVAHIHSQQANRLQEAGFEVIEPEIYDEDDFSE